MEDYSFPPAFVTQICALKLKARSGDLGLVHSVRTGPQLDSAQCHASGCADNISQELTNNFNKVREPFKE